MRTARRLLAGTLYSLDARFQIHVVSVAHQRSPTNPCTTLVNAPGQYAISTRIGKLVGCVCDDCLADARDCQFDDLVGPQQEEDM